jgi:hypothetical protein
MGGKDAPKRTRTRRQSTRITIAPHEVNGNDSGLEGLEPITRSSNHELRDPVFESPLKTGGLVVTQRKLQQLVEQANDGDGNFDVHVLPGSTPGKLWRELVPVADHIHPQRARITPGDMSTLISSPARAAGERSFLTRGRTTTIPLKGLDSSPANPNSNAVSDNSLISTTSRGTKRKANGTPLPRKIQKRVPTPAATQARKRDGTPVGGEKERMRSPAKARFGENDGDFESDASYELGRSVRWNSPG